MKKFFSGLFATILILIIIGGIGYIGYSFLFGKHAGMNMSMNMPNSTQQSQTGDSNSSSSNSMNMQSGSDQMNMQNGSMAMNGQNMQANSSQQSGGSPGTQQLTNFAMENRDKLDNAIALLDDSLKTMTLDPYSSDNTGVNPNTQPKVENNQTGNTPAANNTQGNTTINIYPANGASNTQSSSSVMANMGASYDADKMQQLHNGLYKISLGMQQLKQLEDDFLSQAELSDADMKNPAQYYMNQYYLTIQYKSKLNQAITNISEAADLVNINPYVSSNGLSYDKERMRNIHQSIVKLAQGTLALNKLNDDMTKQIVSLSNNAQGFSSMPQMNQNSMMQMPGLFDNINIQSIINIILIIFISAFIIGILGFIFSLFKSTAVKASKGSNN